MLLNPFKIFRIIVENPFHLDTETLPSNYNTKAIHIDRTLRQVSNTCKTYTHKKKGWWTNDLRELRAHSITLLRLAKQNGDSLSYRAYSIARSAFHKHCKAAKEAFMLGELEQLKELVKAQGISALFSQFKKKGPSIACPITPEKFMEASKKLFACFSTPKLLRMPSCTDAFNSLIAPIELVEVQRVLSSFKSRAPALNGFSPRDLREVADLLSGPISQIFNCSLNSGKFPLNWLDSCLFFIYKKGDKSDCSNYRSISIENPFLKTFMAVISKRLYSFSENNNLLPRLQFGFRKKHSTSSAATLLFELAKDRLNNGRRLYSCFFDFKKAFDFVDRSLLFIKLQILGVPFPICNLLFHILQNLKLHIRSDSQVSDAFYSTNGVPQGDPLSPLLFSLFTSNLPDSLAHVPPTLHGVSIPYLLFADDLVVLADSQEEIQIAIDSVVTFCEEFNLTINKLKTQYMVFYNGSLPVSQQTVSIGDTVLPNTNSFTYLGFTFTTRLRFSTHADHLCKKAESRIGLLFQRLPLHNLPLPSVISVFELYVLPIFRYGLFLWFPNCSSSSHSRINSVFTKFLKRYLRIPKHSNNALTYLLTQTEPLTYSLKNLLRSSYSSLTLPNIFSGYKPSIAEQISSDTVTYDPSEFLPEHYKHAPIPTVLSTDPTRRHKSLKYTFDTIHYSYCNNSVFHFPNDQCICKFCSQECIFFHFQCCPVGIL